MLAQLFKSQSAAQQLEATVPISPENQGFEKLMVLRF
jgi:hypothetical protein